MAVDTDILEFDEYHLVAAEHDALITMHGLAAEVRIASACACLDPKSKHPDPACLLCFRTGFQHDAAVTTMVHGPQRRPRRNLDAAGALDTGDVTFTFLSTFTPSVGSRLILPNSPILVSETLIKGERDRIRFSTVMAVDAAHYTRRDPPDADEYDVISEPLAFSGGSPDLAVDLATREVTWLTNPIPDGTPYVLRLTVATEFLIWEPQDRAEGGDVMPYRYVARRFDRPATGADEDPA